MEALQLLGGIGGLSLVSGINLYATVLVSGLLIRFDLIALPPSLEGLSGLENPWIIGVAAIFYIMEFVSDKIPWIDNAWDLIHTFIRPFGAAGLAWMAVGDLHPAWQVLAVLLAGGIAVTSHGVKAGGRATLNLSSPAEGVSNTLVSLGEDALAIGGTWLTLFLPILMLLVTLAAMPIAVILLLKFYRRIRGKSQASA